MIRILVIIILAVVILFVSLIVCEFYDDRQTCIYGCVSDSETMCYEQGYDTGALCGSKLGYDTCIKLLQRTEQ